MRYIDIDDLVFPAGWFSRAAGAAAAVAKGGDPDDGAHVWRELKDALADLLPEKKCWYCESPVDRSDNAVDHFRPKGRVSDAAKPHSGYRWLAFEPSNYRYSCTFCNSRRKDVEGGTAGGKGDRFPLIDESARVYSPGPIDGERPTLLDPCKLFDWRLLGCRREDGEPCPATQASADIHRVVMSIEIYHLDLRATCVRRHAAAVQLLADLEHAKRLFTRLESDPTKETEFLAFARRVKKAIHPKAPYSGEMIFLLRGHRDDEQPWIEHLLAGT